MGLWDGDGPAKPLPERDTEIADILESADHLRVICDKIEELNTPDVLKIACKAAADAYRLASLKLEDRGRKLNAREAFEKAAQHYKRAGSARLEREMRSRAHYNIPDNGNIYGW